MGVTRVGLPVAMQTAPFKDRTRGARQLLGVRVRLANLRRTPKDSYEKQEMRQEISESKQHSDSPRKSKERRN
jgi:hypothetical protein